MPKPTKGVNISTQRSRETRVFWDRTGFSFSESKVQRQMSGTSLLPARSLRLCVSASKVCFLGLFTALLSACSVGPDYVKPVDTAPQSWRIEEKKSADVANVAWWKGYGDKVLDELIEKALKENKDLLIATARIDEYAAQYGVARSEFFPQLSAGASYTQQQTFQTLGKPLKINQLALNASWELDLWGKIRRGSEAARADLLASEEGRRSTVLSLVSSVASSYIGLRDLDKQLEIARQTAKSRKESLDLFQIRFEGGVITELELAQNRSEYEQAMATIPQLEKSIALQEHGISLLLGANPGPVPRGKSIDDLPIPLPPKGIPSDILQRRPDILQAEQTLIAANAQIGVARAAYFPSISLTGLLGVSSSELSSLFKGPGRMYSYAASLTAPIFTAGKTASQVKVAEAQQQQALLKYQQTIQTAFREVEDGLVEQNRTREQLAAQKRQVAALRTYASLARLRFDNGYSNFLDVLDAERSLFNAELNYSQTQGDLHQYIIGLYKAMGGGWGL